MGWYRGKAKPGPTLPKLHGLAQGKSNTLPDLVKNCMGWYREKQNLVGLGQKWHGFVQGMGFARVIFERVRVQKIIWKKIDSEL